MNLFDVFNNGTVTIVRCGAAADGLNAPVANFVDADGSPAAENVIDADVPAQISGHRTKLLGNENLLWSQYVVTGERDIRLTGTFGYLGQTGEGYGVVFTDARGTGFGRITDVKPDPALIALPNRLLLVVEVLA